MTALILVHLVHVVAGVVWAGGQVVFALAVWPALLKRPAAEARATLDAMGPYIGALMATSGFVLLGFGLLRGIWLGPIRSVASLDTPYGRTFLVAFALTVALSVHGARSGARIDGLFDGDAYHPRARRRLLVDHTATLLGVVAVLVCMVLMRFGL